MSCLSAQGAMGDPRNSTGTSAALQQAERSAQFATFRRLIDRGIAVLEARDAPAAIAYFTAAYDLAVEWSFGADVVSGVLLNLSIARRLAGDYDGALEALERALALHDLTPAQRAALWNHLGIFYGERSDLRRAAACCIRAYRLAVRAASDPNLCAEAAGNVVDSYLHFGAPEKAVRWAARAAWHARRATAWRRQYVAVQTVAVCLATGRLRLAERILRRLERESLEPDWVSQFLRLRAEWWFRAGDRRKALAWAARALDAAVRDMSPEDIEDACRALQRFGGRCPNPHWERHLLDALRSHQELIGAFARASADLDLGADPQLAVVLASREGRILLRAGGNEVLDRLAEQGCVAGAVVAETEWDAKFARAAVTNPRTRFDAPNPGRDIEGYVLVWPPLPTLAQAIASLTSRIHTDEDAARLRADNEQALAKLAAFHDAALALGGPLETGEVVTRLLALTQQLSHSDGVALLFTDPARGTWAEGLDGEVLRRSRVFQTTADRGRPQRLTRDDPRARDDLLKLRVALIAVPVYFGGTECGAVLAAARLAGAPFSEEDLELVSFISKQFGLALENAALRDDLNRRLEALTRDLRIARRLQQAFMPGGVIREDGVVLTGMSVPAKYVGGDVYDFVRDPDGSWRIAIGDVMGKGVGAAMLGSILLARLREAWTREPFGPDLVRHLDERLAPDLRRGRSLATLLLALYCPRNRHLHVLAAGHDGPVLWRGGTWRPIARGGGTALGLLPGRGVVAEVTMSVQPGDVVLFYSDGFGELLLGRRGISASRDVAEALGRRGLAPAGGDEEALLKQIEGLPGNGDQPDDVTVVVFGVH